MPGHDHIHLKNESSIFCHLHTNSFKAECIYISATIVNPYPTTRPVGGQIMSSRLEVRSGVQNGFSSLGACWQERKHCLQCTRSRCSTRRSCEADFPCTRPALELPDLTLKPVSSLYLPHVFFHCNLVHLLKPFVNTCSSISVGRITLTNENQRSRSHREEPRLQESGSNELSTKRKTTAETRLHTCDSSFYRCICTTAETL